MENNAVRKTAAPVSLAACENYDPETVRAAFDRLLLPLGGLDFIKPGMTVAVKLNLLTGAAPERAVTPHPALIRELCRRLIEKGAVVILGDSPGGLFTQGALRSVYHACGLEPLASDKVHLNMDVTVKSAVFPGAQRLKAFHYTAWLDQADVIIDFCKLKTHGMLNMTGAVKNLFGTIPGTTKPEYHLRFPVLSDFADMLVDLSLYWKPVLCICDAVECMEGNGPSSGTARHMGLLCAGQSGFDLDMVLASLIGYTRNDVATLEAAYRRELGPADISQVRIASADGSKVSDFAIPDFKHASAPLRLTFGGKGAFRRVVSAGAAAVFTTRPQVKNNACIACGKCAAVCPAHAITMAPKPVIDRKKCIRCFCCQEFCPEGAMKVQRTWLDRVLSKTPESTAPEGGRLHS